METIDLKPEKILKKRTKPRTNYPPGTRSGSLTVIERLIVSTPYGRTCYLTQCDCGNTKIVRSYSIKSGNVVSCDQCFFKKKADAAMKDSHHKYIGKTYFGWTVIKFIGVSCGSNGKRRSRYLVRHTCGFEVVPGALHDVREYGRVCLQCPTIKKEGPPRPQKERKPRIGRAAARTYLAPGERFGSWTCIEMAKPRSDGRTQYLCRCDCGTEAVVASTDLKRGATVRCVACRAASWTIYKPEEAFSDEIGKVYWGWKVIKFNDVHVQRNGRALKTYWIQHLCGNKVHPKCFKSLKLRGLNCTECTLR